MRPLSETIANSGVGKKLCSQSNNGLLADNSTIGIKGRQTGDRTVSPRKGGTFSLQNGYGHPLNGLSNGHNFKVKYGHYSKMDNKSPVLSKHSNGVSAVNGIGDNNTSNYNHSPYLNGSGSSSNSHLNGDGDNSSLDLSCNGFSNGIFTEEDLQERFYVNETPSPTDSLCNSFHSADEEDEHPFFAGMRDIRNPDTLRETRIVSSKGTIRGVRNRVKAGIATFLKQRDGVPKKDYRSSEKGKIVLYTTSMMIVRDTHEKCKKVKNILQTHMVKYEEHDIFMSRENQRELAERLGQDTIEVPQVFVDGLYLGGATEVEQLNESGELRKIFKHFRKISHGSSCENCGGYRYVPCTVCHGSRKSVHRNHFTAEFCALRCIVCDENGLVKCDTCCAEESPSENVNTKL